MVVEELLKVEQKHYQRLEELEKKKMEELLDALNDYGHKSYIDFTCHCIWSGIVDRVERGEMPEEEVKELKKDMEKAAKDCVEIYKEKIKNDEFFWTELTYEPMGDTLRKYDLSPPRSSIDMLDDQFMDFSNYVSEEVRKTEHEYNKVKERREEMEKYISDMFKDEKKREKNKIRKEKFESIWED